MPKPRPEIIVRRDGDTIVYTAPDGTRATFELRLPFGGSVVLTPELPPGGLVERGEVREEARATAVVGVRELRRVLCEAVEETSL